MTSPAPSAAPGEAAKSPAPDLDGRAPRPAAVRLRRSVVQAAIGVGAVVVAGSLAWAFVVQPDLRATARTRAAEATPKARDGAVRPADQVVEQPATYDRLPEPRGVSATTVEPTSAPPPTRERLETRALRRPATTVDRSDLRSSAARSSLLFDDRGRGSATAEALDPNGTSPPPMGRSAGSASVAVKSAYSAHALIAPRSPYEIKAGTIILVVLLTAVDTSRPGVVIGTVNQNVYDTITGRFLLIPQGARLIGRHEGESAYGDRRAFLTWERLILPNGKSLSLDAEPGVDAQGATGLEGRTDRRLAALSTSTLFAGAITALGQAARDQRERGGGGLWGDVGDGAAIEAARVGGRLVDRELEVRPAIRVRAGGLARVLITRDLILEPYS